MDEFAKAIESDDSTRVQALIDNGLVDANARLAQINAPPVLVVAALLGRAAVVQCLVSAGARIDDVDDYRYTACHAASQNNHGDALAVLLAQRPNLALKDDEARTPLGIAVTFGHKRIAAMLIAAGAPLELGNDKLFDLAARSTDVVQALFDRGVAVNEMRNRSNRTLLHVAAVPSLDLAMAHLLVNVCGVDVNARDSFDHSCIDLLVARGATAQLRWLLATGAADLDAANQQRSTPLHLACSYSHVECVYLLLAAGANVQPAAEWLALRTEIVHARRQIVKLRLDFVRARALQVCIGLQSRGLDALQTCEILLHACGPMAHLIAFHHWWAIATTVKHHHHR